MLSTLFCARQLLKLIIHLKILIRRIVINQIAVKLINFECIEMRANEITKIDYNNVVPRVRALHILNNHLNTFLTWNHLNRWKQLHITNNLRPIYVNISGYSNYTSHVRLTNIWLVGTKIDGSLDGTG